MSFQNSFFFNFSEEQLFVQEISRKQLLSRNQENYFLLIFPRKFENSTIVCFMPIFNRESSC